MNLYKYEELNGKTKSLSDVILDNNDRLILLKSYFYQLKLDLIKVHKKIIIDTHDLNIIEVLKNFDSNCDIYVLGMPNESAKNLFEIIRKNDKKSDWTNYIPDTILRCQCKEIIYESQENYKKCKELGIKFFDTSGNREEKINMAMKFIEENSIMC